MQNRPVPCLLRPYVQWFDPAIRETSSELMPTIFLLASRAFCRDGCPLPPGINSIQELFPMLFHEEDQAFARQWLSEPEGQRLIQLCRDDEGGVQ